jgi:type IV secretory pathway component VirB8
MPDIYVKDRGEENLRKRETNVRAQHVAAVNTRRRADTAKNIAVIALSAGCAWLAYNNGQLAAKAASRDTVYAVLQPNGEFIASTHYTDVPPAAAQEEQIQNALWTYVQARDCYGSSSVVRQFYIAQAMSDDAVGRQVKEQFALANPNAPQHVYGEHGITVQCEIVDPPTPVGDMANHIYMFRFRRWEQNARTTTADSLAASFYTVTVRFRTGVYPEDDKRRAWLDRTTFNAPGVQVIEYPGAKPENAARKTKG